MTTASIVVHKTPVEELKISLKCLQDSPVNKIYVIDNSPDESLKETALTFPKVGYLHVMNHGYGAGHNIGIKKSIEEGADYHLVMNSDISWPGDIITPLIQYLDTNKEVGIITPKTFYPNGELQYTCRLLPTPFDLLLRAFLPERLYAGRTSRYLLKHIDHNQPINSPYILGSFMMFRNDALSREGFFDERFFMYPEDIDITRRIHENWKTLYWPGVSIVHSHRRESKKNLRMFWIHFTNMVKYFNKWGWINDPKRKLFNKALLDHL